MSDLIDPQKVTVTDAQGMPHEYHIGKMPALVAREVLAKYTGSMIPKAGEYQASHEAMLKLMRHVAVEINGELVALKTEALINNHIPDGEALIRLEVEALRRSVSFFTPAGSRALVASLQSKILAFAQSIMPTLAGSLQQLSAQASPPSASSKPE